MGRVSYVSGYLAENPAKCEI